MIFSESLKKNQDFQRVYRAADSRANRYLVLYRLENGLSKNRIGISVSKKVGNSVVRHHMCRLIREQKLSGNRKCASASNEASEPGSGAFVGE